MINDIKEEFKDEFEKTCECIKTNYWKDDEKAKVIVGTIIIDLLNQLQIDSHTIVFTEFYKKHIHNADVFSSDDFTFKQTEELIDQSLLNDLNRKIALLHFGKKMTNKNVGYELGLDERTVANCLAEIEGELKRTASKIYKK